MKDLLTKILPVKVSDIRISEDNMRKTDVERDIDGLANSIQEHGLLQPVILRGTSKDKPPFELIVGQRRLAAHRRLKAKEIYAVFAGEISDTQASILSLTENLHRVQPSFDDVSKAVTALYEEYKRDDRRVSETLDIPLREVRDHLVLNVIATPEIKNMLVKNEISRTDAKRALEAAHGDVAKANTLAKKIVRLTRDARIRLKEYGASHPDASADKIVSEAKKPKIRELVMLNLTARVHSALVRAAETMNLDAEELAKKAVEDWLASAGYLSSTEA